jgi:hypothetical protein
VQGIWNGLHLWQEGPSFFKNEITVDRKATFNNAIFNGYVTFDQGLEIACKSESFRHHRLRTRGDAALSIAASGTHHHALTAQTTQTHPAGHLVCGTS